jgi:hypothetical protein
MTWIRTLCKRVSDETRVWKEEQTWQWVWLRVGLFAVLLCGLLVVVQKVPETMVRWTHLQIPGDLRTANAKTTPKDVADEENEFRKTLIQLIGGGFALVAVYFTWRRVRVAEQGHLTDRYSKAIELLGAADKDGNPNVEVRLGAIYALERIAQDSARDQWTIMEVLTAYVRKNAPAPAEARPREEFAARPATEIQAILTVLGRRKRGPKREPEGQGLDLSGADLRKVNFSQAHVEGANFSGAHVEGADFYEAHVEGANFRGAHVEGAGFGQAHVEGADFTMAYVKGAYFYEAHVEGANFYRANVEGADFHGAHVEGARFSGAHVEGADFGGAHVEGAYFSEAEGLRVEQVQRAVGWEKAEYDDSFAEELGLRKREAGASGSHEGGTGSESL